MSYGAQGSASYINPPGSGEPPWPPAKRGRRKGLIAAATAVALVLVGGGAFAAVMLGGGVAGSATPDEAATAFIESLVTLDSSKITATIAPSELAWFTEALDAPGDCQDQLDPQDLSQTFEDLKGALEITINDLEIESSQLVTSVNRSVITGGSIRLDIAKDQEDALVNAILKVMDMSSELDELFSGYPAAQPSAAQLKRELAGAFPVEAPLSRMLDELGIGDLFVVTVEEGGKWYTSVSMTAAQYVWEATGQSNQDLRDPIPGSEMTSYATPEEAAEGYISAIQAFATDLDIYELAKHVDVAESRLYSVYGPAMLKNQTGISMQSLTLDFTEPKTVYQKNGVADVVFGQIKGTIALPGDLADALITLEDNRLTLSLEHSDEWQSTDLTLTWDASDPKSTDLSLQAEDDAVSIDGTASIELTSDGFEVTYSGRLSDAFSGDEAVSGSITLDGDQLSWSLTDPQGQTQRNGTYLPLQVQAVVASFTNCFSAIPGPESFFALTTIKSAEGWHTSTFATLFGMGIRH